MILGTSVASSKETTMRATSLIRLAARFLYRVDPPMPRLRLTTLTGRCCSSSIVRLQSTNSTAQESHVQSDLRVSHTHCRPTKTKSKKKGHSYEALILSVSLAILTT